MAPDGKLNVADLPMHKTKVSHTNKDFNIWTIPNVINNKTKKNK